jgi:hypothetical protein
MMTVPSPNNTCYTVSSKTYIAASRLVQRLQSILVTSNFLRSEDGWYVADLPMCVYKEVRHQHSYVHTTNCNTHELRVDFYLSKKALF